MSKKNTMKIYAKMLLDGTAFDEDNMPDLNNRITILRKIYEEYADEFGAFTEFISEEEFSI